MLSRFCCLWLGYSTVYTSVSACFVSPKRVVFEKSTASVATPIYGREIQLPIQLQSLLNCARACKKAVCQTFYFSAGQGRCVLNDSADAVFDPAPRTPGAWPSSSWASYVIRSEARRETNSSCGYEFLPSLSKCVSFHKDIKQQRSFDKAVEFCASEGGQIIDFCSSAELLTFSNILRNNNTLSWTEWYIGLRYDPSKNTWKWVNTGIEVATTESLWASNQPNGYTTDQNSCAYMRLPYSNFLVGIQSCYANKSFVCQYQQN